MLLLIQIQSKLNIVKTILMLATAAIAIYRYSTENDTYLDMIALSLLIFSYWRTRKYFYQMIIIMFIFVQYNHIFKIINILILGSYRTYRRGGTYNQLNSLLLQGILLLLEACIIFICWRYYELHTCRELIQTQIFVDELDIQNLP